MATAESITGGRLGARLTDGAGSSARLLGAVVSYATEVKISVLGVPEALVDDHGVVSEECARSMAERVRALLGTTYGVSTTGVAGPDTQEDQPVGTVFVGCRRAGRDRGPCGSRSTVIGRRSRQQTVAEALSALAGHDGRRRAILGRSSDRNIRASGSVGPTDRFRTDAEGDRHGAVSSDAR